MPSSASSLVPSIGFAGDDVLCLDKLCRVKLFPDVSRNIFCGVDMAVEESGSKNIDGEFL